MNKNNIAIIISVIVLLGLVLFFISKNNSRTMQETPIEVLDKSTKDDGLSDIEAELNSININASSSEDFKDTDMEINNI